MSAFAAPGTLARKRQQRGVNDTCVAMRTCRHDKPAVGRGGPESRLYDYVCPDCGTALRTYVWERGQWVRVGGVDA